MQWDIARFDYKTYDRYAGSHGIEAAIGKLCHELCLPADKGLVPCDPKQTFHDIGWCRAMGVKGLNVSYILLFKSGKGKRGGKSHRVPMNNVPLVVANEDNETASQALLRGVFYPRELIKHIHDPSKLHRSWELLGINLFAHGQPFAHSFSGYVDVKRPAHKVAKLLDWAL